MTAPDFAAVIDSAVDLHDESPTARIGYPTALILAAKVPTLCPTCGGKGHDDGATWMPGYYMPCLDCPTIAKLLAIGAAVMGAELERCEWVALETDGDLTRIAGTLLNRLRAVQP